MKNTIIFLSFLLVPFFAKSQLLEEEEQAYRARLIEHVEFLAHDSLEGRATGSRGEQIALDYIIRSFRDIGISPPPSGYIQAFDFQAGRLYRDSNYLRISGRELVLSEDYFPMPQSANAHIRGQLIDLGYGISDPAKEIDDYQDKEVEGQIGMINLSVPGGYDPHGDMEPYAQVLYKAETAIQKGLAAILLYNEDPALESPGESLRKKAAVMDIPVLFVKNSQWLKEGANIVLSVDVEAVRKTGHNVVGWLDNGAAHTVAIGAHYDHLGMGEYGSLYTGEPAVHNGADDNASGTALMIELARYLKNSPYSANNYLFIGFSGEELGLYGSKSFTESAFFNEQDINYMINMDMVGRLDPQSRKLAINGVGTSPSWDILEEIPSDSLILTTSESGIGPSDHTSFYLKDIPAIHFFTGTHADYHKPSDDADKVNYEGMISLMEYILQLIAELDDDGRIAFTKTKEEQQQVPRFSVTLGVVPDYMFDGKGMRIDAVRDNRPAARSGIRDGDIVIKMGDYRVADMMSYMKALSKFKKGDQASVIVLRGEEEMVFDVEF